MSKAEFVWLMLEIKRLSPQEYERVKSEMWQAIVEHHGKHTDEERAAWKAGAS